MRFLSFNAATSGERCAHRHIDAVVCAVIGALVCGVPGWSAEDSGLYSSRIFGRR